MDAWEHFADIQMKDGWVPVDWTHNLEPNSDFKNLIWTVTWQKGSTRRVVNYPGHKLSILELIKHAKKREVDTYEFEPAKKVTPKPAKKVTPTKEQVKKKREISNACIRWARKNKTKWRDRRIDTPPDRLTKRARTRYWSRKINDDNELFYKPFLVPPRSDFYQAEVPPFNATIQNTKVEDEKMAKLEQQLVSKSEDIVVEEVMDFVKQDPENMMKVCNIFIEEWKRRDYAELPEVACNKEYNVKVETT